MRVARSEMSAMSLAPARQSENSNVVYLPTRASDNSDNSYKAHQQRVLVRLNRWQEYTLTFPADLTLRAIFRAVREQYGTRCAIHVLGPRYAA